jgi:2-oxoglutarate dehydrogenase E1 component
MSFASRFNLDLIEDYFARWRENPASVDESWRAFFEGFELASRSRGDSVSAAQAAIARLINGYRLLGHFSAHLDPLEESAPALHPHLQLTEFGLSDADLDKTFATTFMSLPVARLRDLLTALRETYCGTIGYEFQYIEDLRIHRWFHEHIEPRRSRPNFTRDRKRAILHDLKEAELFETFLHTRYQGQKRFSLEGAEPLIPLLEAWVQKSPDHGVQEYVIGMAHRGRLNVLVNVLRKPYQEVFAEFEDRFNDTAADGDGDVKYHLGFSADVDVRGHKLHLSLTPNPSHLEAVNAVVQGRTRAKQEIFGDRERRRGIPILIHGDAAFAGQGSVMETLNLARLEGYTTGGTLHVIVNNQIGFTTNPVDARSTNYCTDVAKMIQAPIFHVNGEDPEAVIFAAELALEFRQEFNSDVIIDLYCYRKHGHNEGDDPFFTQPLMYQHVKGHPSASRVYAEHLVRSGDLTEAESHAIDAGFRDRLDTAQKDVKSQPPRPRGMARFGARWTGFQSRYSHNPVPTGISRDVIRLIADRLTQLPVGFIANKKIHDPDLPPPGPGQKPGDLFGRQRAMAQGTEPIDWGFAETLAYGSLLLDQTTVRLSGQDVRRGTFTHRHAALVDQATGARYVPLDHLRADQARLQLYDSPLSEFAVLGFEFGYALDDPKALVLWEAQFGDFANGAQVVIDQFIASCESKWQRANGIVLLLPHGYEGQGPEHSSARLERFLQLCADDNIQVCYPTTPAQLFHMLRRQVKRSFRKPLIVMTPKSLLRHAMVKSSLDDITSGSFREVIDDGRADPSKVRRVVLCTGKVYYDFYYDSYKSATTEAERVRAVPPDVAVIRLEQLYPFPTEQLDAVLKRYRVAREWVWAQEEPQNMGGWFFVEPLMRRMDYDLEYVGRDASASPATGSHNIHKREQAELVRAAIHGDELPYLVRAVAPAVVPAVAVKR